MGKILRHLLQPRRQRRIEPQLTVPLISILIWRLGRTLPIAAPAYKVRRSTRASRGWMVMGEEDMMPDTLESEGREIEGAQAYCMTIPPPCDKAIPCISCMLYIDERQEASISLTMLWPNRKTFRGSHNSISLCRKNSRSSSWCFRLVMPSVFDFCPVRPHPLWSNANVEIPLPAKEVKK